MFYYTRKITDFYAIDYISEEVIEIMRKCIFDLNHSYLYKERKISQNEFEELVRTGITKGSLNGYDLKEVRRKISNSSVIHITQKVKNEHLLYLLRDKYKGNVTEEISIGFWKLFLYIDDALKSFSIDDECMKYVYDRFFERLGVKIGERKNEL